MDRKQEEELLRITARYVAEMQAGHQPRLSDYLARYPQHADAIAEFVAYYHAVEADLPVGAQFIAPVGELPPLSESSHLALERAWQQIAQGEATSTDMNTTLLDAANKSGLSLSQLAAEIGLSEDIVEKLEKCLIDAATIPQEILRRLAYALQQPLSAVQASMRLSTPRSSGLQMAEARASYHSKDQPEAQSFREALEQSTQLSEEQKANWRNILTREGL